MSGTPVTAAARVSGAIVAPASLKRCWRSGLGPRAHGTQGGRASGRVRFIGDKVAAVAAETPDAADEVLALIGGA